MNRSHRLNHILLHSRWLRIIIIVLPVLFILHTPTFAKPPDELPGEEITEEQYFDFITPRDSVEKKVPKTSPDSPTWLDRAAKTWDAPPVSVQLAEDKEKMLMGMGAIFIPCMSNPSSEPDVEIVDPIGKVIATGKTGRKYSLMPGKYYVLIGSGPHKQRIVKTITVKESEIIPLVPDWCGLSIDVVDEKNLPFRGEYEMARIDKFIPLGRGFGRDLDLGEEVKTWILKPGTYKIFGVGESYNTLTNFVTVRLLPGELVHFVLVENEKDMTINGGGTVQLEAGSEITSNWKYGIDVGGGIDFNYAHDRENDTVTVNENDISLLCYFRMNYKNDPFLWDSRLKLDEGVTFADFTDFDITKLSSSIDELRLTSLFTWRVLSWLGPYGRVELITEIIPERARKPELPANDNHYFIVLQNDLHLKNIDSTNSSFRTQPSFSPITLETGAGANMNVLDTRYFDMKILTGIGFTYERHWAEWKIGELNDILDTIKGEPNPYYVQCSTIVAEESNTILIDKEEDRIDVGPEVLLHFLLRIGAFALVESELKYFAPFKRIPHPDLQWRSVISWRLIRMVTLDYEYKFILKQPEEEELKENESRHRILLRFSYTTR